MKLSYNNYTARFCDGGVEVFKGDTLLYYNKRPMYAFIKTALAVTEFLRCSLRNHHRKGWLHSCGRYPKKPYRLAAALFRFLWDFRWRYEGGPHRNSVGNGG